MPWGNENLNDKHMPFDMRLCNRSTIQGGVNIGDMAFDM
jgi:hypothetical protein